MKKAFALLYGVLCYSMFFGTFLYAAGFLVNFGVPRSIDSAPAGSTMAAIAVDVLLLSLFAVQHSVMARPWFKRAWTRFVPEHLERSTYVLFSSVAMLVLFWKWQPIGGVIWSLDGTPALFAYGMFAVGISVVLLSTFLINHFDLFGLRQVYLYALGRKYTHLEFRTPFFYRYVRHPLYVGWVVSFWSTPVMTAAHLLFAVVTTAYMLTAIRWEEGDLMAVHGDKYRRYRNTVPMMIPALRSGASAETAPKSVAAAN